MKFDIKKVPELSPDTIPQVGDIYAAARNNKTKAWLVVAVRGQAVQRLGISEDGEIISAQSSSIENMRNTKLLGHCPEFKNMTLSIELKEQSNQGAGK